MNYIWDLLIQAEQEGLSKKDIFFKAASVYSPYMELSPIDLNIKKVEQKVEINPYYRFHLIFRDLFDANNDEALELRHTLLDIVVHLLAEIDLIQGMSKREYYIKFVLRDLEAGIFGEAVKKGIQLFDRKEKEIIAANILLLYETGEAVYLLKDTMRKIFKKSIIYANCEEKDELLFYIGQKENEKVRAKIELIKDLFLPVRFHTYIYWEYHFGIFEVEKTMKLDQIALY